jgi:hypothetical protein
LPAHSQQRRLGSKHRLPLPGLVIRSAPRPTDPVFPRSHHVLFNSILMEQSLKFDRDGQRRSAYSLCHTYISPRLMDGADIYQIAKNCRTSVEMIEQYYAAHIKNVLDATVINVRSPGPTHREWDGQVRALTGAARCFQNEAPGQNI